MILLIHDGKSALQVKDLEQDIVLDHTIKNPTELLFSLAKAHPNKHLLWCHNDLEYHLNINYIKQVFAHHNVMISYRDKTNYVIDAIGYVEDSPFLKVNKSVKYPTWLMSSHVGTIYAETLLKFKEVVSYNDTLDYTLNSVAKIGITQGLFCYSDPKLLNRNKGIENNQMTFSELFKFVSQHYKKRWINLLLFNSFWHDKTLKLGSFFKSMFTSNKIKTVALTDLEISEKVLDNPSIDVLIPTIGREKYLLKVLEDLSSQTILPTNIIIVEQNPDTNALTGLGFIESKEWPFKIRHQFIHQTGACNARNIGLKEISSDYIFLADDDILIPNNTLEYALKAMQHNHLDALTISCLQKGDKETHPRMLQWSSFGSGCSIVTKDAIKNLNFDMAFEHGFGEDADFGMQMRNSGYDIGYLPHIRLDHLKAPVGGFRTKHVHAWEGDDIAPKPSPTVMLSRLRHTTKHQLLGYKTVLFFKFYSAQNTKNPWRYLKKFRKQWKQSVSWANKLNQQER